MDLVGQQYGQWVVLSRDGLATTNNTSKWTCRCSCGTIKSVFQTSLRSGSSTSCGCTQYQSPPACTLPAGEGAFRQLLRGYKRDAARRTLIFTLTDQEAKALFQGHCHYCGTAPSQTARSSTKGDSRFAGTFTYNGIDRKDNAVGYTADNSVSCCNFCNLAKRTKTYSAFTAWLDQIVTFRSNPRTASSLLDSPYPGGTI